MPDDRVSSILIACIAGAAMVEAMTDYNFLPTAQLLRIALNGKYRQNLGTTQKLVKNIFLFLDIAGHKVTDVRATTFPLHHQVELRVKNHLTGEIRIHYFMGFFNRWFIHEGYELLYPAY